MREVAVAVPDSIWKTCRIDRPYLSAPWVIQKQCKPSPKEDQLTPLPVTVMSPEPPLATVDTVPVE